MSFILPEVDRLLSSAPELLPLVQSGLRPEAGVCQLRSREAASLFPSARQSNAALAGLLLRLGCWEESHSVAQDVNSTDGSYWHAILHRMEPDASNAGYWFRRVSSHAIFPDLHRGAGEILQKSGPKHWRLPPNWDPFLFISWCDEALKEGGQAETVAREIQDSEVRLLFDWCASPAAS